MFIRIGLNDLGITNPNDTATIRTQILEQNSNIVTRNNSDTLYTAIGLGLFTTILTIPDMRFKVETYAVTRTTFNKNNLRPIKHKSTLTESEKIQQDNAIASFLTGYHLYPTTVNTCPGLYIIKTTVGFTILKKWLTDAGYDPVDITFEKPHEDYKADVYAIGDKAFLITNDIYVQNTYKKLFGWLPALLRSVFKNLRDYTELYEFYKTCYNTGTVDKSTLKTLTILKNLKDVAKHKAIDLFLKQIQTNKQESLRTKLNDTQRTINDYEKALRSYYILLNTYQKQQTTGVTVADVDLIAMCLKNNPNVQNIRMRPNDPKHIELTLYGPVEYDKKEVLKILKHQTDFIRWLFSNENYTLCWESVALLDIEENKITTEKSLSTTTRCIRNTHWHRYACLGNNRSPIEKALATEDYLSAVTQTITAAQLLNIYDYTVLSTLIDDLTMDRYTYTAFKDNNTGALLSTQQLNQIFKEEKKKEETETHAQ